MKIKNNMAKNLSIVFILTVLFFSLIPSPIYARLVPCGPGVGSQGDPGYDPVLGYISCRFCHFFVLFDNIVKFVLQTLVPPIAALMLAIGGLMFFGAAGDPAKINKAKSLFTSVAIGLFIVYGAYLFISLFFMTIGVNELAGLQDWFVYPCP